MTYDRERQRIGFWKTNCSELWKRLHIKDAPAGPSTEGIEGSAGTQPASAPNGPLVHPGMLFQCYYESLKSRLCPFVHLNIVLMEPCTWMSLYVDSWSFFPGDG